MEPRIVFEDESLLVIDKPAGMVVNRAETTRGEETIQDWVENYLGELREPRDADALEFFSRSGIVHRLDKETSGLLLIAKTPAAFLNLKAQFKNRQVKKKYLALVHGRVVPEEGEIKAPLGRLPWNRKRFGVVPGGREAVTRYKILRKKIGAGDLNEQNHFSLLELSPLTGRTHQIRVHLKYLGYPVVGDNFYAGRKRARDDRRFCPRLFLHASFLQFYHPKTSKEMRLELPLPKDLEAVLSDLENLKTWRI
jgi:23S rRNA pseudouridine1911/1915/1917 synthase